MKKGFYALQLSPNERSELEYNLREYLASKHACNNKIELRGLNILKKVLEKTEKLREKRRKRRKCLKNQKNGFPIEENINYL